ncbi:conjugative transposon protein TraM [Mucilaginibacter lutimaris]|uniref:Conjugative transposon protein TraM n=1 Tax=Mucilaginibacter lutimaris TaxID=931629 RepID=A0ABW2ZGQ2_9SPHI
METTLQQQRNRKALLVLPLVVFAFTTLLFRTFGGGQAYADQKAGKTATGFNTRLPDAQFKDERGLNKMSFYDRAAADSAKFRQAQQTDPYANQSADATPGQTANPAALFSPHQPGVFTGSGIRDENSPAAKEMQLNKRLAELQAALNKPATQPAAYARLNNAGSPQSKAGNNNQLNLQAPAEDPELKQMNGLLEKLLDVQHPERVREKINKAAEATAVAETFKAIPAVIDGSQKIVQGTVIRMRLLDSVRLNGQLFNKGQLIYGSGDLYNQRVKVNIKLIHVGLNIIPVDLTVYDRTDGLEGISVPEAVTGDALKDGAVNGIQTMDMMTMDPSVTAQLATAGLNTAKGLFSKKVRRVKGKLKNGHELLLRDNLLLKKINQ